jgi:enterochelin esterase-like enzyme
MTKECAPLYPLLYLLDGEGDNDTGWYAIGRANVILDNLQAQGKAKPMVVVMPFGHTVAFDMKDIAGSMARNLESPDTNQRLKLLWIACGTKDVLA